MTDAELVARARSGDVDAFGALVERHGRAVGRAARAALGDAAEADDVAQETFVKAWHELPRFRGESSVRTWLLTIAWRRAIDRRRSLRRLVSQLAWGHPHRDNGRPDPTGSPPAEPPEAATAPSPEQALLAAELAATTRRLVGTLPAALRDVLLLSASGEHTMEEIAAMTRTPTGTVKWRVAEARRRLREKLERLGLP